MCRHYIVLSILLLSNFVISMKFVRNPTHTSLPPFCVPQTDASLELRAAAVASGSEKERLVCDFLDPSKGQETSRKRADHPLQLGNLPKRADDTRIPFLVAGTFGTETGAACPRASRRQPGKVLPISGCKHLSHLFVQTALAPWRLCSKLYKKVL